MTGSSAPAKKKGWLRRLRDGLGRSSQAITESIGAIFTKRTLDDDALEELEDALIAADLGAATAARLSGELAKSKFNKDVTPEDVRTALADEITAILSPVAVPLDLSGGNPRVILVVGVNGTGKTTTIGKLASQFRAAGRQVLLVAGDTFRAAAVAQLRIWAERTDSAFIARDPGADAAGLAFDGLTRARAEGHDVVLIDTAGRLQNKAHLMDELAKIIRVLRKIDPTAPHDVLLTLDATTGQNAHGQVEIFKQVTAVTGLVVTKLDGTAKGGVVVALAERFGLPIHAVGVGEGIEDLRPFEAAAFARSLMGLEAASG